MWHRFPILIGFAFIMVVYGPGGSAEEPASGPGRLEIIGGNLSYDVESRILRVTANEEGDPTAMLAGRSITAKSIIYHQDQNVIHADQDVRLWDQGAILEGGHLVFSVSGEEGTMDQVKEAELSRGVYFYGESLTFCKVPAKKVKSATEPLMRNQYTLFNGVLTACELPYPHYDIKCKRVVVIPDERVWVYDMIFRASQTSLFYAPFFTQTLREDAVLTYFFNAGSFSHLGYGFFNRLMYKPDPNYVFNLFGDYYTQAGIGKGANFIFDVPGQYGPKGKIYGYHILQEDADNDFIFDGKDRYSMMGQYEQNLPYDIRVTARGHQFSDSEYRYDYSKPERNHGVDLYDIERDTVSFVNIAKAWDSQSVRLTAASRLDSFYYSGLPYIERTPQLHYEMYPVKLFDTDWMADVQLDYGRYRREEGSTFPVNKSTLFQQTSFIDEVERFDSRFHLSHAFHLLESFTFEPWIGYRATHYADAAHWADDPSAPGYVIEPSYFDTETRSMFEGGAELYNRQTHEFETFLGRYDRMRVLLEPVLEYGYFHPDIALSEMDRSSFQRFPYIDLVDEYRYKMHRVSSLFRAKVQGKDAAGVTSDFLRFTAGISYDQFPDKNLRFDNFDYFDDLSDQNDERFADLIEEFSISPMPWLSLGNSIRYDIEDSEMRSAYYYTNVQPVHNVSVSLGYYTYRFLFLSADEQQDIALNLRWILSKKWELFYHTRYDLDEGEFRWNNLGVVRDMHDFYAIFQIEHESHPTLGDDISFQIGFRFWGIGGRQGQAPIFW